MNTQKLKKSFLLLYQGVARLDSAGGSGDQRGQELPPLAEAARRAKRGALLRLHPRPPGKLIDQLIKLYH